MADNNAQNSRDECSALFAPAFNEALIPSTLCMRAGGFVGWTHQLSFSALPG